jgi:hypothetical protein
VDDDKRLVDEPAEHVKGVFGGHAAVFARHHGLGCLEIEGGWKDRQVGQGAPLRR